MMKKSKTKSAINLAIPAMLICALIAPTATNAIHFGAPRAVAAEENQVTATGAVKYESDYDSETALVDAARELNIQMSTEGSVLLKNKNSALPLKGFEKNITVFHSFYSNTDGSGRDGAYSRDYMFFTGHGSAALLKGNGNNPRVNVNDIKGLYDGLVDNGINYNPLVKALYDNNMNELDKNASIINKKNGPQVDFIRQNATNISEYNDAAIITISRVSSENADVPSYMNFEIDEKTQTDDGLFDFHQEDVDHYLQLNTGEKELLAYAKENFEKVIVLLNIPSSMEVSAIEDDDNIDALLWVGFPGFNGLTAIADVLTGKRTPSGKTVDTWASNMSQDPTWQNFGSNVQNTDWVNSNCWIVDSEGNKTISPGVENGERYNSAVDYEEGIYLGYKFYETAADIGYFEATKPQNANDMPAGVTDRYYNRTNGVTYPFGYGLSYTTFDQTIKSSSTDGDNITLKVKVTNTGNYAGKEVVQVYYNPPYTDGGIEKATANLVAFAKTKELAPSQSQTLTLTFAKRDMASYDYNDANKNTHKGYELEAGAYEISINADSHNVIDKITYNHASTTYFDTDSKTGAQIKNRFSAENGWDNVDKSNYAANGNALTFLSRKSAGEVNPFVATFPTTPTAADLTFSDEAIAYIVQQTKFDANRDDVATNNWAKITIPEDWTQADAEAVAARTVKDGWIYPTAQYLITDMAGVDYMSDEVITGGKFDGKTGKEAWTLFMNQLTYDEMTGYISSGRFGTGKINAIAKKKDVSRDGPSQIKNYTPEGRYSMGYTAGIVLASSWNKDLAYEYGKQIGEWGLLADVNGWYGPAINIHRSPLGGRSYEYLSEDGILAGYIAAGMVSGAASKGMVTYIKHFAFNSQEFERGNVCEFMNEQVIREIYLKPFELAVKAGATGMMSSFNRIGGVFTATSHALQVEILEGEWGFRGSNITDYYSNTWPGEMLARCHQYPLNSYDNAVHGSWDATEGCVKINVKNEEGVAVATKSDVTWYAVRTTAMHMLYAYAHSHTAYIDYEADPFADKEFDFVQGGITGSGNTGDDGCLYLGFGSRGEMYDIVHHYAVEIDGVEVCNNDNYEICRGLDIYCGAQDNLKGCIWKGGTMMDDGTYVFDLVGYDSTGKEIGRAKRTVRVIENIIKYNGSFIVYAGKDYEADIVPSEYSFTSKFSFIWGWGDGWEWDGTGMLPEGLTLDKSTGHISGKTTATGVYPCCVLIDGAYEYDFELVVVDSFSELRIVDGYIQGKANGEWFNVISLEDFKGEQGEKGETGAQGIIGATGATGATGAAGADGVTPTIEISEDGYWVINGVKTETKAIGVDGKDGADGADGKDGANGKDGTNGKDGVNGKDGADGSGCGGAVGAASAMGAAIAAIAILGGASLILRKKRKEN